MVESFNLRHVLIFFLLPICLSNKPNKKRWRPIKDGTFSSIHVYCHWLVAWEDMDIFPCNYRQQVGRHIHLTVLKFREQLAVSVSHLIPGVGVLLLIALSPLYEISIRKQKELLTKWVHDVYRWSKLILLTNLLEKVQMSFSRFAYRFNSWLCKGSKTKARNSMYLFLLVLDHITLFLHLT